MPNIVLTIILLIKYTDASACKMNVNIRNVITLSVRGIGVSLVYIELDIDLPVVTTSCLNTTAAVEWNFAAAHKKTPNTREGEEKKIKPGVPKLSQRRVEHNETMEFRWMLWLECVRCGFLVPVSDG